MVKRMVKATIPFPLDLFNRETRKFEVNRE